MASLLHVEGMRILALTLLVAVPSLFLGLGLLLGEVGLMAAASGKLVWNFVAFRAFARPLPG